MSLVDVRMNEKEELPHYHAIDKDNYTISRSREETHHNGHHHIHRSHEVLFVESGRAKYSINGIEFIVEPGDILSIGATEHHKYIVVDVPFQRYGFTIKPAYFRNIVPIIDLEKVFQTPTIENYEKFNKRINPETFSIIIALLKMLKTEQQSIGIYRAPMERGLIAQLTILLYRNFGYKQTDSPMPSIYKQMLEIKEYITTHYEEDLSLKFLADKFYLHSATISKNFPKYCGQNLNKYINQVRISEATKLLETTNENIVNIAYQCGYENEATLLRQFKQIMEISPARYRKDIIEYTNIIKNNKTD
ncbi:MAG: AraC family transcriptional regulator [Eubacteriales bacterium]